MNQKDFYDYLNKHIDITVNEKTVELIVRSFFANNDLTLTVFSVDGVYYVHDNNSALSCLKENAGNKFDEIFEKIKHPLLLGETPIFGKLTNLMNYLQILVFVANADLIYESIRDNDFHWEYIKAVDMSNLQKINCDYVCDKLDKCFSTTYIEDKGLIINPKMIYPLNNTYPALLLEKLTEDKIKISDCIKKGYEGAILETFYWYSKDINAYADFIQPFFDRFGGELENKELVLTDKISDGDIFPVLFRFLNLAILFSQLGQLIILPKR